MSNTIKDIIRKPQLLFLTFGHRGLFNWMSDEQYLKIAFKIRMGGELLNFNNVQTFNEKLQWLKLYDRRPEYTKMVDKQGAKEYVESILGSEYIIPTIGIWNSADEIDFDTLPNRFVLKCTHDSGGLVICKDKKDLNKKKAIKKLNGCLKHNFFWGQREWPYKDIKPRIIAEQYMEDAEGGDLKDYKFFCFNGVPKAMFIASDRNTPGVETKFDFFDMDFNHLPFTNGHPNASVLIEKPSRFEEMKDIASRLSRGIPHVRVDLYQINGKIYFGELTFFHWSGFVPFNPEEWDYKFGSWIQLPKKDKNE